MRRISRPCYDKYRRCPGWAGGGMKSAKVQRCLTGKGYLAVDDSSRWWRWKFHPCPDCGVLVLPYAVQWISPRIWWLEIHYWDSWTWVLRLKNWWNRRNR